MTAPLQCQQDAARVATTADQAVAYARHQGCRDAFALILDGEPDMARWVLARAVERQARMQGVTGVHIEIGATTPYRRYEVVAPTAVRR